MLGIHQRNPHIRIHPQAPTLRPLPNQYQRQHRQRQQRRHQRSIASPSSVDPRRAKMAIWKLEMERAPEANQRRSRRVPKTSGRPIGSAANTRLSNYQITAPRVRYVYWILRLHHGAVQPSLLHLRRRLGPLRICPRRRRIRSRWSRARVVWHYRMQERVRHRYGCSRAAMHSIRSVSIHGSRTSVGDAQFANGKSILRNWRGYRRRARVRLGR